MTFRKNFREFEFTAFSGSNLLAEGDDQLSTGDSFTMPFSATACITVTDNDSRLSGDARKDDVADDRNGQTADIELDGVAVASDVKIYAERYTVVEDQDGNTYKLIEIEFAGSAAGDADDFFTFYGDVPPPGAELSVVSTGNVVGSFLKYKHLSAGLKWDLNDDGKVTIEAEDMALKGYRTDDIDAASGGEVIKLKKKEGAAELVFGAESGTYDLEIAYVDEDDGQGSIVVEVNGVVVETILLDQDNNGNGNDHSTISTLTIAGLELNQGDVITLRGTRDAHEFARIDALTFCLNENDAPDAVDDAFTIGEGSLLTDDVLGNDSDVDTSDVIEILSANGEDAGVAFNVTSAGGRTGAAIMAPSGDVNLAFDQLQQFSDLALSETDTVSISYTITDGNGATDSANITITVIGDGPATVEQDADEITFLNGFQTAISLISDSTTSDGSVSADIDIDFDTGVDVLAVTIIAFDDSEFFGQIVDVVDFDIPGGIDNPDNPDLVATTDGFEFLNLDVTGLGSDLGDANRLAMIVEFDENGDGILDLPLFVEVDIFGSNA